MSFTFAPLITVALFFIAASSCVAEAAARPRVLIIVADDLGYGDVGFHGCKDIPTPHLDALAKQSVRFTQGYASHPFCSPTRAGLLTGRYQQRFGHEMNPKFDAKNIKQGLPLSETTLPQLFKQAGYVTGCIGKWHLGSHEQLLPMARGFDEHFGCYGGIHVYLPGGRLIKHCVENMANVPGVKADVVEGWPDKPLRDAASTVVFIGDFFPPNRLPNAAQNLADLDAMIQRGCGIVCVHYATGVHGDDVTPEGDHPLLRWLGGYFANRTCKHHESIAKIFPEATITPAAPQHPTARGWKEFTLNDEPYYNNYFGPGNVMAPNVTTLATSLLPPEKPKRETVAWCIDRPDGGRGFGIVMPHFYKNWRVDDLRRFILNGIIWTAKLEVPAEGVQTGKPDPAAFQPESIEYVPPPPKPKKADQLPKP